MTITPVATATSDIAGRFEISFRKSQVSDVQHGLRLSRAADLWKDIKLIATAEGFGFAWSRWDRTDAAGNVVLRLTPDDVPLEGRVLNPEGQPVAGVNVVVNSVGLNADQLAAAHKRESGRLSRALWGFQFLPSLLDARKHSTHPH